MPKSELQYDYQQARVRRIKRLLDAFGVHLIQGRDATHDTAFAPVKKVMSPPKLPDREGDDGR